MALHFQSQTAQFTTRQTFVLFPSVNRAKPSVSIVHFPAIKALEEKNI